MSRYLAVVLAALAGSLALAAPAQADVLPWKWAERQVCIEDHTDPARWPVGDAYNTIAEIAPLDLIYADDCAEFPQVIYVIAGDWPKSKWAGKAYIDRDAADRHIVKVTVALNEAHVPDDWTRRERQTLAAHEVLHALGLDHTDREDSVMTDPKEALKHTAPTAYDASEIRALYAPRGIDYRPAWRYAMPA